MFARVVSRILPVTLLTLPLVHCSGSPPDSLILTAEVPLHLEEHVDAATLVGSEVPADVPAAVEWRFDGTRPSKLRPSLTRKTRFGSRSLREPRTPGATLVGASSSKCPTGPARTGPI